MYVSMPVPLVVPGIDTFFPAANVYQIAVLANRPQSVGNKPQFLRRNVDFHDGTSGSSRKKRQEFVLKRIFPRDPSTSSEGTWTHGMDPDVFSFPSIRSLLLPPSSLSSPACPRSRAVVRRSPVLGMPATKAMAFGEVGRRDQPRGTGGVQKSTGKQN